MSIFDPELRRELANRIRYYNELGIYDFYRREASAAEPQLAEAELAVAGESTVADFGAAVPSPRSPQDEMTAKRTAKIIPAVAEGGALQALAPKPEWDLTDPTAALRIIREDLGDCIRCRLHQQGRKQIVFGVGNPQAELMFVGEGPGADEDAQGEPFVGRAGQLLNNMIQAMGVRREDVYIANVVKCRPPGNRTPERDECDTCSPFLLRQISVIKPRAVVALGAVAAKNLLAINAPMSELGGRWYDFRPAGGDPSWPGKRLAVTYHPAFLLRDPRQKGEAWKDLQMVMKYLGLKPPEKIAQLIRGSLLGDESCCADRCYPLRSMPQFCDVALPVPLDMLFTYRVAAETRVPASQQTLTQQDGTLSGDSEATGPVVGGRVLVPFRQRRMTGIVVELHDRKPSVRTKNVLSPLDASPVLDDQLLRLGHWIANYYLAPLGEVFRTMLPLSAEFKRSITYRITDGGLAALHTAGLSGSSARSRRAPEEQLAEFRVLDYLAGLESTRNSRDPLSPEPVKEETLRAATRASKPVLAGMVRKKWLAREDVSGAREAMRTIRGARLKSAEGKLNAKQRQIVDTVAAAGGRIIVEVLQSLAVSRSTLATLVRRGLMEIIEEPAEFAISRSKARPQLPHFELNPAQQSALTRLREGVEAGKFAGMLLHGVTGSGKTAVYLAGMRAVLDAGRSAILLVPEIGLTPAVAADLHQIFGDEVAILHSALSDKERAEQWHRIRNGEARMVVGTRSAVFAPVADLALIIVDEEHDSSYKQEDTPRYHARDIAVMRAKMANAVVVLGSATPSLESYFNAKKNKYALAELA